MPLRFLRSEVSRKLDGNLRVKRKLRKPFNEQIITHLLPYLLQFFQLMYNISDYTLHRGYVLRLFTITRCMNSSYIIGNGRVVILFSSRTLSCI